LPTQTITNASISGQIWQCLGAHLFLALAFFLSTLELTLALLMAPISVSLGFGPALLLRPGFNVR